MITLTEFQSRSTIRFVALQLQGRTNKDLFLSVEVLYLPRTMIRIVFVIKTVKQGTSFKWFQKARSCLWQALILTTKRINITEEIIHYATACHAYSSLANVSSILMRSSPLDIWNSCSWTDSNKAIFSRKLRDSCQLLFSLYSSGCLRQLTSGGAWSITPKWN